MDTADRLITSTQDLLWERGYVGTSPKAIQERAHAGQGSMYHHFSGKPALAAAAIRRSATELRTEGERQLCGPGSALERISAYLLREREVLRGCRIGRLTQDPDVVADPDLRAPVDETFRWLQSRLAQVLAQGQREGEIDPDLDPADVGSAIAAVLQGGYVLARAAQSVEPFDRAVKGVLTLLAGSAVSRT
ncbi:MAG: TetR/AcrR family transcriptional regulator [Actinomycetota bacterium]|nr:TetR/AcrR family transcriptional regulator [Actinomycetota bacterium]